MRCIKKFLCPLALFGLVATVNAGEGSHPNLVLTSAGVDSIRAELGTVPLFDATVASAKEDVDAEIEQGIDTPVPKDYSGGYTHERHKRNFQVAQKAGALFQVLGDEKYARYIRDMLFQYEAMYEDLPLHPKERSYARGKLFWQCLNDANWLVYMAQAYDAIYDWLSDAERSKLEENLFRPFADHLSINNHRFFNRVHNHSTWGNAAVGMIGLVMGDDELVERALYGLPFDDVDLSAKDNDGGYIYSKEKKAGFLANLQEPFSPDGYYTEGPYYQRYAMYPFLVFAQGLHNAKPELKIFENEGKVLLEGVDAMLNLTDANGNFFPLNDAQKGMSYRSGAVVTAVNIAYYTGGRDPRLLGIAEQQGRVLLDDAGFAVALGVRNGESKPFEKRSVNLSDGSGGSEGGVAVLRVGDEDLALVFKYTAQGLSHGHYDKLSIALYERGDEVLQDYGLARFVNIGQKGGGNYLEENKSWAKQTIAHNTITQNERSHFGGEYDIGSQHHSELRFFDASRNDIQVISARETNAYPGSEMRRTTALIDKEGFDKPFVLDIFQVGSDAANQYDLPFHYLGQIIEVNFGYESPASLQPLGSANGYQHLYVEGRGRAESDLIRFSWLANRKFYTLTSVAKDSDELLFTRLGANDPDFNLRRDPAFLIRRRGEGDVVFVNVIEPHGSYDPVSETAANSDSNIADLALVHDDADYTAIVIEDREGRSTLFVLSNSDLSASGRHELIVDGRSFNWSGPYHFADF
jgi:hypothetical protein